MMMSRAKVKTLANVSSFCKMFFMHMMNLNSASDIEYPPDQIPGDEEAINPNDVIEEIEEEEDPDDDAQLNEEIEDDEDSDDAQLDELLSDYYRRQNQRSEGTTEQTTDRATEQTTNRATEERSESTREQTTDRATEERTKSTEAVGADNPSEERSDDLDLDQQIEQILQQRLSTQYADLDAGTFSKANLDKSVSMFGSKIKNCDLTIRDISTLTTQSWVEDSILDFYAQLILMQNKLEFVSIISAQYSLGG